MKTVSVQIVTFHSENDIVACLDAVFKQTYPVQNVIVVENASHDRTAEIIKAFNENLTFIRNETNVGFAAGHNQAMGDTDSDYVLVLNPDCVLDPDYILRLIRVAETDGRIGSLTGKLLLKSDPSVIDSTGLEFSKARRAFDRGAGHPDQGYDKTECIFGVSGAAALYSRRLIRDISIDGEFFDESFFAYKEDVDVAWRAQIYGWSAVFVPDAVAFHGRGWKQGDRKNRPLFVRRHSYINRYRMMIKNDSWGQVWRGLLHILRYEVLAFGYTVIREPTLFVAWSSLFRDIGRLLRHRKIIQYRRREKTG